MSNNAGEGRSVDSSATVCTTVSSEPSGASPELPTNSVLITPDDVVLHYRDEEFFEEAAALAWLLGKEQLFVHGTEYGPFFEKAEGEDTSLIGVSVNCNDMFAWGCSDSEPLPIGQLRRLYKMVKADPTWGSAKWCCLQRKQRPQPPVERDMRKDGSWDDVMEALPANTQDADLKAQLYHHLKGDKA